MRAYHNGYQIKTNILAQLQAHYEADEIVKGRYWGPKNKYWQATSFQGGVGCAVGCTIHSSDHREYETAFGIPQILALLEDTIFENLPNERAKEWPLKFMSSIYVGADLSTVWPQLAIWILTDKECGVLQYTEPESPQYVAIKSVADLYQICGNEQLLYEANAYTRPASKTAYKNNNYRSMSAFEVAREMYKIYVDMTNSDVEWVIDVVKAIKKAAKLTNKILSKSQHDTDTKYAQAVVTNVGREIFDANWETQNAANIAESIATCTIWVDFIDKASKNISVKSDYYVKLSDKLIQLLEKTI